MASARAAARDAAERDDGSRRAGAMETWSHTDMTDNFPRLFAAAKAKRDDLSLYTELQWGNILAPKAHEGLEALPPGGIYQQLTPTRIQTRRVNQPEAV